jgi:hypothetical protein
VLARAGHVTAVATRVVAALAFVAIQGGALFAVPIAAADGNTDDISVGPRTVELLATTDQQPVSAPLTVTMTGPTPAQVSLQIADAVAAPNGGLAVATIGSTAWSLERLATITPATINYTPNGATQNFTVNVTVSGIVVRSPRAGFITTSVLEVVPSGNGGTTLSQGLIVNTPIIAAPAASVADQSLIAKANLFGASLSAVPSRPWLAIDQVVPDFIPGLVNHGPMSVTARIVNTGDTILRTETTFTFAQIPFDSWVSNNNDPGTEILRTKAATGYALPGQAATISASSASTGAGAATDSSGGDDQLPAIGLIRVTATTTGSVGGVSAPTLIQYQTIVVFPWKEGLAGLLVVIALAPVLARVFRGFFRFIGAILSSPFRLLGAIGNRLPGRRNRRAATPKRGGEVDENAIAERLSSLGRDDAAESAEAAAVAEAVAATGFRGESTGSFYRPSPAVPTYAAAGYGVAGRSSSTGAAGVDDGEPEGIPGPPLPSVPVGPRVTPGGPNAGSACTI